MKTHSTTIYRIVILLLALSWARVESVAGWNNFIINFDKKVYGKGSQTWQVACYNENWVYFANQSGVLQYDGSAWSCLQLNNLSDVRSIYPSKTQKRIYAGGINEFGYFTPNARGLLNYTCFSDSLSDEMRSIGNIWGIHENDNIMYFLGDSRVLKYLNGKYVPIDTGQKIDCSALVNGVLYVGTTNGVYLLIGNTFFSLRGGEVLEQKRIRGIVPYGDGILIVTAYSGLYYNDGQTTVPYPIGIEEFMATNEVFSVAISDNQLALGTVHKGIVLFDLQSKGVKYFNENNGLQNNTVLSVAFDAYNNLWAGLDSGIDYVCLSSHLTNLYSYPFSIGAGYAAAQHDDILYLGTNRGLYHTPYPVEMSENRPDIKPVSNSSGQVWNLVRVNEELFCLHDRGIFIVEGGSLEKIGNINGAWKCQQVAGDPDRMYVGVYDGIYLLHKEKGKKWSVVRKIEGTTDSFRYFEQESAQVIWMTEARRVIRFELDVNLTQVQKQTLYGVESGFPDSDIHINKIDGKVYFSTSKGMYRYNPHNNTMEQAKEIDQVFKAGEPYYNIVEYGDHVMGLNRREICISNRVAYKQGVQTYVLPINMPGISLVLGAEQIMPLNDSLLIIPNENGFALVNASHYIPRKEHNHSVYVRNVFISYPKDSLIHASNFLMRKETPEVPFNQNSLRFEYGITSFTQGEDVIYQFRMDDGEWSDYTKAQVKEYSNLEEGMHTFEVKAYFADATPAIDSFSFRILPPWYRTNAAYICYFLLMIVGAWLTYKWDDSRLKRKKQQAVVEKDRELQLREQEFEEENERKERQIFELEKEKLEHELQYKSQEMANLMINFVRKNEVLTEIKQDIIRVASSLKIDNTKETKQKLLVLNSKIDSNIQSDDVLKRVEEQFDLVHNNFMKRLQEKHPDLSVNERMMCAYLKMNLSSKEIAPLLNLAIRGVETIRYRIRKKFLLGREDSLTDFLNTNI